MCTRGCLHFASLSSYDVIFEYRSGAYVRVGEQRRTENHVISAKIVEM